MDSCWVVFGAALAFLLVLFGGFVYSVRLQRKAVGTQDGAMVKVDESLAVSRESLEWQKKAVLLAQDTVSLLKEANRLLEQLARERH